MSSFGGQFFYKEGDVIDLEGKKISGLIWLEIFQLEY